MNDPKIILFNNDKLRSRIKEKLGSEAELARRLGLPRSALSARFKGVTPFTRNEVALIAEILKIKRSEIGAYFFTSCGVVYEIKEVLNDAE
jgi:transcriptional regulator with XRE-family HTH domain